ncbi:carbohydrate kinase [Pinirhizobacter sp.]|jgi:fructokinase|uniref:carbohydrate kinase family protein n=1 Tax=Pinirhizobacter sp. TaxID=2950432 RepID=UPI002F403CBF
MPFILCFGEALIDFHPQPQATPGAPDAYIPFAGGAPANVAVAVARLGQPARFAGMLGKDMFGDFLLKSLHDAGVDTRSVVRTDEAHTALAFVSLASNGERSFSFYRPPSADLLFRPEHFQADGFSDVAVFHVCSNSMTEGAIAATTVALMRRARDEGALVSFDMNLRPALWPRGFDPRPRMWDALLAADVVKLSAEELTFLCQDDSEASVLARIWTGTAQLVVVTDGDAPMRWFSKDRQGVFAGFAVRAVDTTAAGDAFVGGLLSKLSVEGVTAATLPALVADIPRLQGLLRYAAACGAITVTRKGSFTAIPDAGEVEAFLENNP